MKKFIRTFALLAALIALMAVSTTSLAAAPPDAATLVQNLAASADPEAAYIALTPAERAAVDGHLQAAVIEVEALPAIPPHHDVLMSGREWTRTNRYQVVAKTFYGLKLWTFKSRTKFWYNNTVHTRAPEWSTSGETHYLFWRYFGLAWSSQQGGRNQFHHHDNASGEFAYCPPVTGCVNYDYPVIRKAQYGDGTYSASGE